MALTPDVTTINVDAHVQAIRVLAWQSPRPKGGGRCRLCEQAPLTRFFRALLRGVPMCRAAQRSGYHPHNVERWLWYGVRGVDPVYVEFRRTVHTLRAVGRQQRTLARAAHRARYAGPVDPSARPRMWGPLSETVRMIVVPGASQPAEQAESASSGTSLVLDSAGQGTATVMATVTADAVAGSAVTAVTSAPARSTLQPTATGGVPLAMQIRWWELWQQAERIAAYDQRAADHIRTQINFETDVYKAPAVPVRPILPATLTPAQLEKYFQYRNQVAGISLSEYAYARERDAWIQSLQG